ncbi:MAG: ABC transporter permease subunit [Eubacterium sp.]|nr:ABC transporter permease subunit [Eubacterium sp.]
MRLLRYELKKLFSSKLILVSLCVLYIFNLLVILNFGSMKYVSLGYTTYLREYIDSGSDNWYEEMMAEYQQYFNANLKPEEELAELRQRVIELHPELSEEEVESIMSDPHMALVNYDDDIVGAYMEAAPIRNFAVNAKDFGESYAEEYREHYPGEKGEVLAAKVTEMFNTLAEEVEPYYEYDDSWWDIRGAHRFFAVTLGMVIAIALCRLFTYDRTHRAEDVISSTRHGRKKLIYAKIGAGFVFALLVWLFYEVANAAVIFSMTGFSGAESMWQYFYYINAPFIFNQWQITVVTIITSLFGTLMAAAMIMLVSSILKKQYAALIVSAVLLIVPALKVVNINFVEAGSFIDNVLDFFPSRIMCAITEWQEMDLLYVFGNAVPLEYLLIPVAVIITVGLSVLCFFRYRKKQLAD